MDISIHAFEKHRQEYYHFLYSKIERNTMVIRSLQRAFRILNKMFFEADQEQKGPLIFSLAKTLQEILNYRTITYQYKVTLLELTR